MKWLALILLLFLSPGCANTQQVSQTHQHSEKYYQERWCKAHDGILEYRLPDKTRVDCLTDQHAIEFDFAGKWAESIGQALYYAEMTGRKPGVVLIMEKSGDERFKIRLQRVAERHGITVWTTGPDE